MNKLYIVSIIIVIAAVILAVGLIKKPESLKVVGTIDLVALQESPRLKDELRAMNPVDFIDWGFMIREEIKYIKSNCKTDNRCERISNDNRLTFDDVIDLVNDLTDWVEQDQAKLTCEKCAAKLQRLKDAGIIAK